MTDLTDHLDAIQARVTGDRAEFEQGGYEPGSDVCLQDREFLLVLARKQQAAIDAVKAAAEPLATSTPSGGDNHAYMSGRASGFRIAAELIRQALEAKP